MEGKFNDQTKEEADTIIRSHVKLGVFLGKIKDHRIRHRDQLTFHSDACLEFSNELLMRF